MLTDESLAVPGILVAREMEVVRTMKQTTKCDGCHKKRKLYFFKHQVDSGYTAYCKECAVKCGYFNTDCLIEHKKGNRGV